MGLFDTTQLRAAATMCFSVMSLPTNELKTTRSAVSSESPSTMTNTTLQEQSAGLVSGIIILAIISTAQTILLFIIVYVMRQHRWNEVTVPGKFLLPKCNENVGIKIIILFSVCHD